MPMFATNQKEQILEKLSGKRKMQKLSWLKKENSPVGCVNEIYSSLQQDDIYRSKAKDSNWNR